MAGNRATKRECDARIRVKARASVWLLSRAEYVKESRRLPLSWSPLRVRREQSLHHANLVGQDEAEGNAHQPG
jgi:hypothetical protein